MCLCDGAVVAYLPGDMDIVFGDRAAVLFFDSKTFAAVDIHEGCESTDCPAPRGDFVLIKGRPAIILGRVLN